MQMYNVLRNCAVDLGRTYLAAAKQRIRTCDEFEILQKTIHIYPPFRFISHHTVA
jgi:hypothetical protein